jgi:SPOR domain
MYDTRWPRPGPAMAAVSALVGLLAGVALGISSAAGTKAEASGGSVPAGNRTTTTTLPDAFWTVVLASPNDRAVAEARAQALRAGGVEDAGVLSQDDYPSLGTRYAVYSGLFGSRDEAGGHRDELKQLGLKPTPFIKQVSRSGG